MSARRLFIDRAPGESRGVVTFDDRPERLIIVRTADLAVQQLGARSVGRVRGIEPAVRGAFVELADGPDGFLALGREGGRLFEGAVVEVEVLAEARRGKGAQLKFVGPAEGRPRLAAAAAPLPERLSRWAPLARIEEGAAAREAADEAEAEALAVVHPLPGGGSLAIEPTRALTAVDVDLGGVTGDARRAAARANMRAIAETARLLRLKAIGGLIAIDLIGAGHDGAAISAAAKAAFAEDGPGVAVGPLSRFGLLQIVVPRRERPLRELLCGPDGAPSALTVGLRLLRALEREGEADRGARLAGLGPPKAVLAAESYLGELTGRLGGRFELRADPLLAPDQVQVVRA